MERKEKIILSVAYTISILILGFVLGWRCEEANLQKRMGDERAQIIREIAYGSAEVKALLEEGTPLKIFLCPRCGKPFLEGDYKKHFAACPRKREQR